MTFKFKSPAILPLLGFILIGFNIFSQSLNLIPSPEKVQFFEGTFSIGNGICIKDTVFREAKKGINYLKNASLIHFNENAKSPFLYLKKNVKLEPGQYLLRSTRNGIELESGDEAGFFYGCQTLAQLAVLSNPSAFPFFQIEDKPQFQWRGLHLDVVRHFFPVAEVKKILRVMSLYKLNVFHWHLTDDQGWRIEISGYPELQRISSRRNETLIGHAASRPPVRDGQPHVGFYSKEEIRAVVAFADSLGITIVPEIEMPGHAQAAIAAYPWLGVTGKNPGVWTDWGVSPYLYAPSDSVFLFLGDVLNEVMDLFPSRYIHIGGDEAIKDQWKSSKLIQNQIKSLGLKDEHELQSWFIRRIEKIVNARSRQIIGWDEILEGGLAPNAAVMSWRGEAGGIEAAKQKHYVVMSPGSPLYFDHYQSQDPGEPLAIGGLNTLEKVYSYFPLPPSLNNEEKKYILGAQANLWTEYISSASHLEYMIFPRALALAEACWIRKENKNYADFLIRLEEHRRILKQYGLNFREWK
jgi:hexosaminidase